MISSPDLWDARAKEPEHTDWLCSYDHLKPFLKDVLLDRPRATALVLGSGTSSFPEQLYDMGFKEVLVVDSSPVALGVVRDRNKTRQGIYCMELDPGDSDRGGGIREQGTSGGHQGDIEKATANNKTSNSSPVQLNLESNASKGGPKERDLPPSSSSGSGEGVELVRFDLAVDKGTLDLMMTSEDGWERATRALFWIYTRLRTPSNLIIVSHSPPEDRIELLMSIYWNEIHFKMIKMSTIEDLIKDPASYLEGSIVDYPFSVAAWENEKALRLMAAAEGKGQRGPKGIGVKPGVESSILPSRPKEDLCFGFGPGQAFIYVLEK